ncbi:hypothetical protein [Bacillus paranthracis]|uniref:hypothetical protein n=1 Tax=Bacillus paranthracis TaxID=2026186 RepID=UPI003D650271
MQAIVENLNRVQNASDTISIQDLVEVIKVNSCIQIIQWIKEGKLQTTKELDGTSTIIEEPIVIKESVEEFLKSKDESLLYAQKRRKELDEFAWLNIDDDDIEE